MLVSMSMTRARQVSARFDSVCSRAKTYRTWREKPWIIKQLQHDAVPVRVSTKLPTASSSTACGLQTWIDWSQPQRHHDSFIHFNAASIHQASGIWSHQWWTGGAPCKPWRHFWPVSKPHAQQLSTSFIQVRWLPFFGFPQLATLPQYIDNAANCESYKENTYF